MDTGGRGSGCDASTFGYVDVRLGNMSASETTTKEHSDKDDSKTPKESLAGPSQEKKDNAASTMSAAAAEHTEPVGMSLMSSSQQSGEDGEKKSSASSTPNKTAAGHSAKSLSSASSSTLSSSPSTSSTLSPGRAKMSVSGPSSSKSVLPPAPSSSSSSSATASSFSPSVSPAPPKIHRARKTMNRPPPAQMSHIEAPVASGSSTFLSSDSETAAKRRKLGHLSDGTPEKSENVPDNAQNADGKLFHRKADAVAKTSSLKSSSFVGEADEKIHISSPSTRDADKSLESEMLRAVHSRNESEESSWPPSDQDKDRNAADVVETVGGQPAEYTEVPLGALDIAAADSLTLSPHEGSDAGDTERLEELPLCSCRMEAPRVDSSSQRTSRQCMATESINGELRACTNRTTKGETMRPSSRVPLMVLCDVHRSHMVKHHCCPGCGYFCIAGTFLECCPDQRIAHRFHRGCVTVLGGGRSRANGGGLLFCPHCGEDASEAQEVTIPSFSSSTASATTVVTMSASSTTTPSLPPSVPTAPSLTASTGGMKDGKMPERPVSARMRSHGLVKLTVEQQQPPQPVASAATAATVPPAEEGVDSVGPSLCMPNGKPISPSALPPGPSRAALQKAILTQDTERRKKLRFHPRQLYPAAKQGEVQRVLLMLMEGIDPTYQPDSQNRRSALHAAAQRGLLEVCYMLVQAGAQVDAQDKDMRTPLLEAIINNHIEVARYLIQNGACVYHIEEDGYTGLHHAAKLGNLEIVGMLLETGQVDVNAQDSGGWTPIIWAAEHKHVDVIKSLLNRGADVSINDKSRLSHQELNVCLHWAAYAGNVDIAELVLNAGCSLASVNVHGDTPLHIAAREGYLDCVTLFLSRGADIDVMNREGDTPLTLARADTPVWVSLQINRKLRRGITNRMLRTERIICSDIAQGYENVPIPCVNAVDDEGCPSDYKYVSENCETSAMNIDRNITHLQHCSCTDDCSSSNCLCGQLSIRCWYDKDQRLLQEFNKIEPPLIFECNMACSCYRTCKNRVVQAGIKVRLQLYRTEKMGWGVRALQDIPQGSFICEYVGELISDAEADVREDDSYLFDLDNKDGEVYCIDARYYGNISRFINHLCDPNLIPVRVFMLHQDLRFPRIAFFSSRDILSGQELGFDYGDRFWDIKSKYFTCQCGSEKCKHSAEAIALEQSRLARLEICPESGADCGMTMMGNS
ncbi:histone-lysine N-methyltransferase EHMT2 isoform X1 [Acanthochromis polyacanthus]|uniref:histone-lysine N-methyltransferase EHMT2 isoform X1 n=1 Tax=Acanthochromis polyacanthus TaxID=80966 RepID=UPI002234BC29|nr:histone-lysine N-methyltransferase EHMT2 isoform X1 [Acanthochromis polyacanthus]